MKKNIIASVIFILSIVFLNNAYSQDQIKLKVSAGKYYRDKTPVIFKLPDTFKKYDNFTLIRRDTGKKVDVQKLPGKEPAVVWLIRDKLKKGKERGYILKPYSGKSTEEFNVTCDKNDKNLIVKVGDKTVLQYNHAMIPSPVKREPFWKHNAHIHPVYNPAGQVLTDDFPPDHKHQRGIFFAWVKTTFKGKELDFWNLKKKIGTVIHKQFDGISSGSVFGYFQTIHHHIDNSNERKPITILEENWTVRVYNISDYFLFDIISKQVNITDAPLKLKEHNYGGMAVRGTREWQGKSGAEFLTSEKKKRKSGNHTTARWVDFYGEIEKKETGIAVMCHPENFRFPQSVRIHPKNPYFCFAPVVSGEFSIKPGDEYISKYRFYSHNGPLDPKEAERIWQDYAEPPEVKIVK